MVVWSYIKEAKEEGEEARRDVTAAAGSCITREGGAKTRTGGKSPPDGSGVSLEGGDPVSGQARMADEGLPSYEDLLQRIMQIRCSIQMLGQGLGDVHVDGSARESAPEEANAGNHDSASARGGTRRSLASGGDSGPIPCRDYAAQTPCVECRDLLQCQNTRAQACDRTSQGQTETPQQGNAITPNRAGPDKGRKGSESSHSRRRTAAGAWGMGGAPSSPPAPAERREGGAGEVEAPGGPSLEREVTEILKCMAAATRGRRESSETVTQGCVAPVDGGVCQDGEEDDNEGRGCPPKSDAIVLESDPWPSGSGSSLLERPIVASVGEQASSEVFVDEGCEHESLLPLVRSSTEPATSNPPLSICPTSSRRQAKKRGGRVSSEVTAAERCAQKYIRRRSHRGSKTRNSQARESNSAGRRKGNEGAKRKKWRRHLFSLGQPARPGDADVPASAEEALASVAELREGEGAWVRRGSRHVRDRDNGRGDLVWTYAILKKRRRAGLEFILDERGGTKELPRRAWARHVRAIARGGGDRVVPTPDPESRPLWAGEDEDGRSLSDVNPASLPPEFAPEGGSDVAPRGGDHTGTLAETDGPQDGRRVEAKLTVQGSRPSTVSLSVQLDGGGESRPKEHQEYHTPSGPCGLPKSLPLMPPTSVSDQLEEDIDTPQHDSEFSNSTLTIKW